MSNGTHAALILKIIIYIFLSFQTAFVVDEVTNIMKEVRYLIIAVIKCSTIIVFVIIEEITLAFNT